MTPRPVARHDIISSGTVQPPPAASMTQPPTSPSSPNRSRSRTAATRWVAELVSALNSASVRLRPAELNWCVRIDSSCSLGTSAGAAAAIDTSVPQ